MCQDTGIMIFYVNQGKLEKRVEQTVKDFLKKTSIVTTEELKELKKEIRELKGIVNALAQKSS